MREIKTTTRRQQTTTHIKSQFDFSLDRRPDGEPAHDCCDNETYDVDDDHTSICLMSITKLEREIVKELVGQNLQQRRASAMSIVASKNSPT
jgi:hypothetical protein